MISTIHQELRNVADSILESVVFAFSEDLASIPSYEPNTYLTAEVGYTGKWSGVVTMIAPETLCQEWASMMSDDLSETIVHDTLAELTNVIAGHWVSQHFAANDDIKLNPPRVTASQSSQWDDLSQSSTTAALCVDGQPLLLHVKPQE